MGKENVVGIILLSFGLGIPLMLGLATIIGKSFERFFPDYYDISGFIGVFGAITLIGLILVSL